MTPARYAPRETWFRNANGSLSPGLPVVHRAALAPRERAVLEQLVKTGLGNKAIAHALTLTEGTVKIYMTRIRAKIAILTGISMTRVQLAQWAQACGMFTPSE